MAEHGDHTAIVTGAASGIGRAVAQRLLTDGIDVLAVDIDHHGLAELGPEGVTTLVADIGDAAGRSSVSAAAGGGVDYLVNAAGVLRFGPLLEITEADWRHVFTVNVEGLFFLSQALAPRLRSGGAIVNIASMAAKTSDADFAGYSASKAAVLSVTRSFALGLADRGIRVNSVSPGIIDTPMQDVFLPTLAAHAGLGAEELQTQRLMTVPLRRIGSPEEVASVVAFLLSAEADYVTGEDINVSAGLVTW